MPLNSSQPEEQMKVIDHMRANQIDSSDYEDGEYEEVGDDYDEDEDEEVIGVT